VNGIRVEEKGIFYLRRKLILLVVHTTMWHTMDFDALSTFVYYYYYICCNCQAIDPFGYVV
jgi:hypothetical protein